MRFSFYYIKGRPFRATGERTTTAHTQRRALLKRFLFTQRTTHKESYRSMLRDHITLPSAQMKAARNTHVCIPCRSPSTQAVSMVTVKKLVWKCTRLKKQSTKLSLLSPNTPRRLTFGRYEYYLQCIFDFFIFPNFFTGKLTGKMEGRGFQVKIHLKLIVQKILKKVPHIQMHTGYISFCVQFKKLGGQKPSQKAFRNLHVETSEGHTPPLIYSANRGFAEHFLEGCETCKNGCGGGREIKMSTLEWWCSRIDRPGV